jgi:hexosaminidase
MLKFIKTLGATGVLIEWEDTFPYEGSLEIIRSGTAYTKDEVRLILKAANDEHLDIIPLVQTFGHFEWLLKHETFSKHRQLPEYPQVMYFNDYNTFNAHS